MRTPLPSEITRLLVRWTRGDQAALDQLMPVVYEELHKLARIYLGRERSDHTLQPTALINEAYLRLVKQDFPEWRNGRHFYGVAAQLMRQILVDYARSKQSQKRGGWQERVTLSDNTIFASKHSDQIVALDDVLKQLALLDERKSRVVELKFFGGLNIDEIAHILKISPETVKRDWRFARTWLLRELAGTN